MLSFSELIGKLVMVMITFRNEQNDVMGYKQLHGTVRRSDKNVGVTIFVEKENKEVCLPPDLLSFQPAVKGEYTESMTGEVVTNPDYLCLWEITDGSDNSQGWKRGPEIKQPD